ncbi:MAG: CpXC domain-containing protein [Spirochaetaceae bacterium]|jgi:hypothetical protein|nr:CpXC domain-containing protein [Spirochaetaceae bacterium]
MQHKIPCYCDNTFIVDVPEEINLDTDPQYVEDILAGNFMNFTCTSCGKRHKPEFPLTVKWQGKGLTLEVLPELDRGEFYRRKEDKSKNSRETVISYPELAERIAMVKEGLTVEAVESIKYYLYVKADESYPEENLIVWYHSKTENGLEFHIHGIKKNEVAVMRIPHALYEKTLTDFKATPKADPFPSLRVKSYCSIQNILRPDELK